MSPADRPSEATCELLARLFAALDWTVLGEVYCEEGGAAFWADRRDPVVEAGLAWARQLAPRVAPGGASLYVGAGVAELPVLLTEVMELGRQCRVHCLRAAECAALNRGLAAVGVGEALQWRAEDARLAAGAGPFDHVSLVSVLSDPETYGALSAVAYGRADPLTLDAAAFERQRADARALVGAALDLLTLPAVVTTTVEEVPWIAEAATQRGWHVGADDELVETAVVGDPIGFLRLEAGP
ncbi:MAG: hypothetical protein AAF628_04635 [Planctomycetota bacterium]